MPAFVSLGRSMKPCVMMLLRDTRCVVVLGAVLKIAVVVAVTVAAGVMISSAVVVAVIIVIMTVEAGILSMINHARGATSMMIAGVVASPID
ncbi:MAG: hypothetical protein Q8R88_02230 [Desulfoprunum sp.]|nr:hypothetical protein [Desulfoprunum sp.]